MSKFGFIEEIMQYIACVYCTHRVITVIEEQRLVVLGSTALFTKVGHIQMIGKRGGEISYLYRQNKGRGIRASGRI